MSKARENLRKEAEEAIAKHVALLALDFASGVKSRTPIDTGFARANWTIVAGGTRSEAGSVSVLSFRFGDGPLIVGNSAVYINRLNNGHSRQAPAGFVQQELAKALTRANRRKTTRRRSA